MIKNTLITFFLLVLLSTNSYSAGTSSGTDSNSANNYNKAVKLVKAAKKYENDGNVEKANKRYMKALKLLIKSNVTKKKFIDNVRKAKKYIKFEAVNFPNMLKKHQDIDPQETQEWIESIEDAMHNTINSHFDMTQNDILEMQKFAASFERQLSLEKLFNHVQAST